MRGCTDGRSAVSYAITKFVCFHRLPIYLSNGASPRARAPLLLVIKIRLYKVNYVCVVKWVPSYSHYTNQVENQAGRRIRNFRAILTKISRERTIINKPTILDKINGKPRPPPPPLNQGWENGAFLPFARLHPWFGGMGVCCSILFCPRL